MVRGCRPGIESSTGTTARPGGDDGQARQNWNDNPGGGRGGSDPGGDPADVKAHNGWPELPVHLLVTETGSIQVIDMDADPAFRPVPGADAAFRPVPGADAAAVHEAREEGRP